MKISMFHLMPHRELPADFEQRYHSVWVDPPWWELADAEKVGQYYNWTLDELTYAAGAGLDGLCVNEHHQNAYGFMPGPNLMGSALARATNGQDVAIVQMGATLPTTNPPIRVAEEYGMLDCISGGTIGGRNAPGFFHGRQPVLRHSSHRASRPLLRSSRPDNEGLAGRGNLRLERQVLPASDGEPLATPDTATPSPGLGPRYRESQHLEFLGRQQPLLLLPELLGQQPGQECDGRVLGIRRPPGTGRQPLPRWLPAARGRGGIGCAGGEGLLRAHPLLLTTSPCTSPRSSSPHPDTWTFAAWTTPTERAIWTRSRRLPRT